MKKSENSLGPDTKVANRYSYSGHTLARQESAWTDGALRSNVSLKF